MATRNHFAHVAHVGGIGRVVRASGRTLRHMAMLAAPIVLAIAIAALFVYGWSLP